MTPFTFGSFLGKVLQGEGNTGGNEILGEIKCLGSEMLAE